MSSKSMNPCKHMNKTQKNKTLLQFQKIFNNLNKI